LQGLVGFARAAFAPEDRNLAELGLDGGLIYKGLIPSRDWDTIGVAFSYLKMSDDLRRAQDDINALFGPFGPVLPEADYEAVLEINYKAQVAAWWTLQTSVQRVFHPGGRVVQDIPDAWAFIVQTTVRF
jgi:porin